MRPYWLLLLAALSLPPLAEATSEPRVSRMAEYVEPSGGTPNPFLAPSGLSLPPAVQREDLPPGWGRGPRATTDPRPRQLSGSATRDEPPGTFVPLCQRLPFHANAPPAAAQG
jgi:hypothetical protein